MPKFFGYTVFSNCNIYKHVNLHSWDHFSSEFDHNTLPDLQHCLYFIPQHSLCNIRLHKCFKKSVVIRNKELGDVPHFSDAMHASI